jgi:hypothetical protein
MVPGWLHLLALASLSAGFACAAIIAIDELRHPQHMWIMNIVWPVTALFASFIALCGYSSMAVSPRMKKPSRR